MIPHPNPSPLLVVKVFGHRSPSNPTMVPVLMRAVVEALSAGESSPTAARPGDVVADNRSVQETARPALHLGGIVFRGSCSTYAQGLFDWFTVFALDQIFIAPPSVRLSYYSLRALMSTLEPFQHWVPGHSRVTMRRREDDEIQLAATGQPRISSPPRRGPARFGPKRYSDSFHVVVIPSLVMHCLFGVGRPTNRAVASRYLYAMLCLYLSTPFCFPRCGPSSSADGDDDLPPPPHPSLPFSPRAWSVDRH